ncbi:MAG: Asp-tRNA(Asn)/Glu-tRNA(Gln) amidotransferase subunit GatC [Alphaproteobacteria bacterium]
MSLDEATVARIARLARIEVAEDRLPGLARELSNILGWVEQLGEVATDDVEPLRAVMPIPSRRRDDVVTDGNRQADVLRNAPEAHDGFYVVPRVVE